MNAGYSSAEAEKVVLAQAIHSEGWALDQLSLSGDDFENIVVGQLYDLVLRMHSEGAPVSTVSVSDALQRETSQQLVRDGQLIVAESTDWASIGRSNLDFYADIVHRESMRRKVRDAGLGLQQLASELDIATAEQMTEHAQRVFDDALGQRAGGNRVRFIADLLPQVLDDLRRGATFTPTPWPSLNEAIGGLRPGALYIVAARPGIGKTVIAQQLASKLAESGMVAFSSLEMSDRELIQRIISDRAEVYVGRLKDAALTEADWGRIAGRRRQIELNIAIDDRAHVSIGDIRQFARNVARRGKLAGVVVDYLQLMGSRGDAPRHEQVADFSRQLKILAKEMQIPVIALSQLNRNSTTSANARPQVHELRESGAIEQDADVIILLNRSTAETGNRQSTLSLDIAKNRHGQTGVVDLNWDGAFSRALDLNGPMQ